MLEEGINLVPTAYSGLAAEQYDDRRFTTRQGRLFAALEFEELERAIAHIPRDAYTLEVGCGTGRFSKYLAERGYRVRAVDPSLDMIRVASAKCKGLPNVTFSQQEGANLSFPDSSFDFVFAIRVTNITESEVYALKMIGEMIRVAKQKGHILIEFSNRNRPLPGRSACVKLSFSQLATFAREHNCSVERRAGILVFSQTLLNKIPRMLVPIWSVLEWLSSKLLWRWASRCYVLLKKN